MKYPLGLALLLAGCNSPPTSSSNAQEVLNESPIACRNGVSYIVMTSSSVQGFTGHSATPLLRPDGKPEPCGLPPLGDFE